MVSSKVPYYSVSNYFIALSNSTGNLISNLKLQKLMYYAQAWYLALYGVRLFDADFEAWIHGPVLPSLYRDYKRFGWKAIEREDLDESSIGQLEREFGIEVTQFLNEIVEEYFGLSAYELERLTHKEDPWLMARAGLSADEACDRIISDESMRDFYKKYVPSEKVNDQKKDY